MKKKILSAMLSASLVLTCATNVQAQSGKKQMAAAGNFCLAYVLNQPSQVAQAQKAGFTFKK